MVAVVSDLGSAVGSTGRTHASRIEASGAQDGSWLVFVVR
jgi:hypothetical protein